MRWLAVAVSTALSLATPCAGGDRIVVHLLDGRTASGGLDSATDATRLWVNTSEEGIALRSGFQWSEIRLVVHDSTQRSAGEFRKLVGELPASKPALMDDLNPPLAAGSHRAGAEASRVTPASFTPEPPVPVRSLRVRAWAANWDDDPELDGVLVEVTPLGPHGEFVAVDGHLGMTLIGEHSRTHPEEPRTFRRRYPEIARGAESVRAEHFLDGPAVYKLPYRNLFPEAHLDLFPQGVLTATLGVSGQGNFTASTDALALVPASPIRDRRQQWFGRRYFPQELSRLRDQGRSGVDRATEFISLGRP